MEQTMNDALVNEQEMRIFVTGGSGFIGTTLIDMLLGRGITVLNYDIAPPQEPSQRSVWRRGDILDPVDLTAAVQEFAATHVVHLAARADLDESGTVDDYPENIAGVSNMLAAVQASPTVERLINTSTQMVCQPGYWPKHDEDYSPNTVYGESKIVTERLTRAFDLRCPWTIIRPTNIWGPRHPRHSGQFFGLLKRGLYWHPRGRSARRCWGYVGNVAYQILRILELPAEKIDRQTLYVGDAAFDLVDWVNGVSMRLTGRPAKKAPRSFLFSIALAGEAMERMGLKAPLSMLRYKAMTEDYLTPIERTIDLTGPAPYTMDAAIDETLAWLANRNEKAAGGREANVAPPLQSSLKELAAVN
jgi:nucleoside-diphosphate-sugar epimerase